MKRKGVAARWVTIHLPPALAKAVRDARLQLGLSTVAYIERLIQEAHPKVK